MFNGDAMGIFENLETTLFMWFRFVGKARLSIVVTMCHWHVLECCQQIWLCLRWNLASMVDIFDRRLDKLRKAKFVFFCFCLFVCFCFYHNAIISRNLCLFFCYFYYSAILISTFLLETESTKDNNKVTCSQPIWIICQYRATNWYTQYISIAGWWA